MFRLGDFSFISTLPPLFTLFFLFVFGMFIFTVIKSVRRWKWNNAQPVLTVWAKVTAKRQNVHHSMNQAGMDNMQTMHTFTDYYATFEVESGDRMELAVPAEEYGLLAEDDTGKLTFQGTRYKGFIRDNHG